MADDVRSSNRSSKASLSSCSPSPTSSPLVRSFADPVLVAEAMDVVVGVAVFIALMAPLTATVVVLVESCCLPSHLIDIHC